MHPIVSVDELAERLGAPRLRLCDVRWYLGRPGDGRAAYDAGHLPGALFVDLDTVLAAPPGEGRHPLPDPVAFARSLGALGVGDGDEVVAYDDGDGSIAARLWWMLDALGHPSVAVLDGGVRAWVAGGHALSTTPVRLPAARLRLTGPWPRTIDRHELRRRLIGTSERARWDADATGPSDGSRPVRLLDVRAPERYRGEVEPVDPVAGHIPGAVSAPLAGDTDELGRFLPPEVLTARYRSLADDRDVVVQCGSGINACHAALAMRIAGLPDPLLYAGSYSDWSRAGWPVVTGPEPGVPVPDDRSV